MTNPTSWQSKILQILAEHSIQADLLIFSTRCHTVAEAAAASNAAEDDFVKSICLLNPEDELIVAIVKGEDCVDRSRVRDVLQLSGNPRLASAEEILVRTGYPCGGTPAFGYPARFLVDERVLEKEWVLSGGGDEFALLRITPWELLKANRAQIAVIRKA